uniref:Uncharacterized protein n=1 Tax=Eutreptiella gymnastica TaxID=73025 RepID=A0A7S1IS20_9EUGL
MLPRGSPAGCHHPLSEFQAAGTPLGTLGTAFGNVKILIALLLPCCGMGQYAARMQKWAWSWYTTGSFVCPKAGGGQGGVGLWKGRPFPQTFFHVRDKCGELEPPADATPLRLTPN